MKTATMHWRDAYRLVRPAAPAGPPVALDAAQRSVVAHAAGPLLVLGGPGTGKTTALVEAVAARVADGADPERVLVLTFGRRAATALRRRIAARIGRTTREPLVRTFHAYAFGVLRRVATEYGEPPPRLLTGPEQDLVIRELLAADPAGDPAGEQWPSGLRAALRTRAFAGELRDLLLRAAERGVGPERLADLGRRLARADWVAAADFARQYAGVLALRDTSSSHASIGYDTAELIRAAAGVLAADGAFAAAERDRCRHVYVDELHDTDPAQVELLALLAGGGGHLVAFGDPDSSTFAFRGADPGGVTAFPERFRTVTGDPAAVVTFDACWRTGGALLAATRNVAARLRGPARHRVRAAASGAPDGEVEVRLLRSTTQEAAYVAHKLREAHLLEGVPWSAMAVLVRSANRQLAGLRRALAQAGVPVNVAADDLPLAAQPAVAPMLLLLRCALDPDQLDEQAAVALLHSPYGGADPMGERRLRQGLRALALAAGDPRGSAELLVDALREPAELAAVEERWAQPAIRIARLLALARDAGGTVEDALWAVWQASGLAERWARASAGGGAAGAAADRDLDAVVALFDVAARFVDRLPGAGPGVFVDHILGQQVPGDSLAPAAERTEAVQILTAHAAKGREWDVVAVAGVQEGAWPDLRLRGSLLGSELLVDLARGTGPGPGNPVGGQVSALLDEERRLFYVAVTRARRRLVVTAVASGDGEEQPSRFADELVDPEDGLPTLSPHASLPRPLTLAGLVAELRSVVVDPGVPDSRRAAAAGQLARLAAAGVPGAHPEDWWGLRELSDPRPLVLPGERVVISPSVVELVRRCGLQWLLERHGGGRPPGPEQNIGTLVHAALASLPADVTDHVDHLRRYLDEHWASIELPARWITGRKREEAEAMLGRLATWLAANARRLLGAEEGFRVQVPDAEPAIEVAGKVDRVELDEAGRLVVVDLKTGRSVPSDDQVAAHPQLGAYQLAVALGAFTDLPDVAGDEPGGAALLHVGPGRKRAREQRQAPLAESDDPGWAEAMVREAATVMAAGTFHAVVNDHCERCAVAVCCPLSKRGRQVGG